MIGAKRGRWVLFIDDIVLWIMEGVVLFYVLVDVNEGELRI